MKKIHTIIRKSKLKELKKALSEFGVTFFFNSDLNCDCNIPSPFTFKGILYSSGQHLRCSLFFVIQNDLEDRVIQKVLQICYTDEKGDGMIFVSDIGQCYRIDDQQRGVSALNFS